MVVFFLFAFSLTITAQQLFEMVFLILCNHQKMNNLFNFQNTYFKIIMFSSNKQICLSKLKCIHDKYLHKHYTIIFYYDEIIY